MTLGENISKTPPGFKITLTQAGLNYAAAQGVNVLSRKVSGMSIPEQHGTADIYIGSVDYDFTEMTINSFTKPSSQVTVSPGGITWSIRGAALAVHGNWHVKYKILFITHNDNGDFDLSASGIDFAISFILGSDSGHPTIHTTGCSSSIDSVDVHFHGGASWLYNLFDGQISDSIHDSLKDLMCKSAENAINVNLKKKLSTVKLSSDIDGIMDLDYRLVADPDFGPGFLTSFHKGEVFWKEAPSEAPFSPDNLPTIQKTTKMVYMQMSDYVFNTLSLVAHEHGLLVYNLTNANLPDEDKGKLNTTCHQTIECLGFLIPQAGKLYPDATFAVHVKSFLPPSIEVTPLGISIYIDANITYYALLTNGSQAYLFTTNTTLTGSATASIKNESHKLIYTIQNLRPSIQVIQSNIGDVSSKALTVGFAMASKILLVKINGEGAKGIDIPSFDDVELLDTQIQLEDHCLTVSSDIQYQPEILYFL